MKAIKQIAILVLILITLFVSGCTDSGTQNVMTDSDTQDAVTETEPKTTPSDNIVIDYDATLVKNYEIVETEDLSMKALEKPLSSYSSREIEQLPLNIRKIYRVVVQPDISKDELKSTLIQVVLDKTSENSDIDEIAIFAYDRKEDADGAYTLGTVNWCPNGDWAGVTPTIASTNDRSSYQYKFDIKDKVGNIDTSDTPTEREYEIYDYYNDRYDKEVTKIYETNEPEKSYYSFEEITKINEEIIAAENAFITEVAHKYNISEDEAYAITIKVYVYENT